MKWDVEYDDHGMPVRLWLRPVCDPKTHRCGEGFHDRAGQYYQCVFKRGHQGPCQYGIVNHAVDLDTSKRTSSGSYFVTS